MSKAAGGVAAGICSREDAAAAPSGGAATCVSEYGNAGAHGSVAAHGCASPGTAEAISAGDARDGLLGICKSGLVLAYRVPTALAVWCAP